MDLHTEPSRLRILVTQHVLGATAFTVPQWGLKNILTIALIVMNTQSSLWNYTRMPWKCKLREKNLLMTCSQFLLLSSRKEEEERSKMEKEKDEKDEKDEEEERSKMEEEKDEKDEEEEKRSKMKEEKETKKFVAGDCGKQFLYVCVKNHSN